METLMEFFINDTGIGAIVIILLSILIPIGTLINLAYKLTKWQKIESKEKNKKIDELKKFYLPIKSNRIKLEHILNKKYNINSSKAKQISKLLMDNFRAIEIYIVVAAVYTICWIFHIILVVKVFLSYSFEKYGHVQGSMLGLLCGTSMIWWVFYGQAAFNMLGLFKLEKIISGIIYKVMNISKKGIDKLYTLILAGVSFILNLFYVWGCTIIHTNFIGEYVNGLIFLFVCIAVYYYYISDWIAVLCKKTWVLPTQYHDYDIKTLKAKLKNNTYLNLLIIYGWGIFTNNGDSQLLQLIGMLFLFDTFLINNKQIDKECLENKNI